ncbi:MAG: hypothetical protein ACJAVI_003605 [Candidatus Azotimanducaceae bacterium]|jgi:hypothetical protein
MNQSVENSQLRFIPYRKKDVVEMCLTEGGFDKCQRVEFIEFCRLLESVYHFEYHQRLERLKDAYAPLNPDRDTIRIPDTPVEDEKEFVVLLESLLNRANYERLSDDELRIAMEEASLFKLRIHVDFEQFSEYLLFTRGEKTKTEVVSKYFGLIKTEQKFSNFDRVVVYVKFRPDSHPVRSGHKPGTTLLKLFQNVPKADIEILFPDTRVGMRTIDKLMIGVPAVIGGGAVLMTKAGAALLLLMGLLGYWVGLSTKPVTIDQATLIAIFAGVGAIGSFIWKQFANFKNRKLTFMQTLTENLYFKNLDNNAGVFHRLVDDAEEEECKEAMLAYYFLLSREGLTDALALDKSIETWFAQRWDSDINFEVEDALAKLVELGLVRRNSQLGGGEMLEAKPLADGIKLLNTRWDQYFN